MKKYFVLYNNKPCGGIVYTNENSTPLHSRKFELSTLSWIIAFNGAKKRTWDYFWFSKFADNAFDDLLSAQKYLLATIFKY